MEERSQLEADGLFDLAKQEGIIEGSNDEYQMIYKYVRYGQANTDQEKEFFKKIEKMEAELEKRKEKREK